MILAKSGYVQRMPTHIDIRLRLTNKGKQAAELLYQLKRLNKESRDVE